MPFHGMASGRIYQILKNMALSPGTRLDRTLAIKVLPEHVPSDPDLHHRFKREAKICGLSQPHICTLPDVGENEGTSSIVG